MWGQMKSETILISKEQFEAFVQMARGDQGTMWEQLQKFVLQSQLDDLMNAWSSCEQKDPSGLVTVSGLVKELGLV